MNTCLSIARFSLLATWLLTGACAAPRSASSAAHAESSPNRANVQFACVSEQEASADPSTRDLVVQLRCKSGQLSAEVINSSRNKVFRLSAHLLQGRDFEFLLVFPDGHRYTRSCFLEQRRDAPSQLLLPGERMSSLVAFDARCHVPAERRGAQRFSVAILYPGQTAYGGGAGGFDVISNSVTMQLLPASSSPSLLSESTHSSTSSGTPLAPSAKPAASP